MSNEESDMSVLGLIGNELQKFLKYNNIPAGYIINLTNANYLSSVLNSLSSYWLDYKELLKKIKDTNTDGFKEIIKEVIDKCKEEIEK